MLTYIEDHIIDFELIQYEVAPANYWNDPEPAAQEAMLKYSIYLPFINNLK